MIRHKIHATVSGGGIVGLLVVLVSCSGNGPGVSTTPTQPNNPGPVTQPLSVSIALSQAGSNALPTASNITSIIAVPKNNAPPGTQLNVSVSISPPKGTPAIPASNSTAFEYFAMNTSADVTFSAFPKIRMTLPSTPKSQGKFYVWMYDSTASIWTDSRSRHCLRIHDFFWRRS